MRQRTKSPPPRMSTEPALAAIRGGATSDPPAVHEPIKPPRFQDA